METKKNRDGRVIDELAALKDSPHLKKEAREAEKSRGVAAWYVFVKQLGDRYYVGRTIRHPSLDIVLPSVLIECVACAGYRDAMSKGKTVLAKYRKRYGARAGYQRGYLMRTAKDPYTAPAIPVYSYDPAMVRQV